MVGRLKPGRRALALALLVVGASAVGLTVANAAVETIGFDDLPPNTPVFEQYADEGVTFRKNAGFESVIIQTSANARSGGQVAQIGVLCQFEGNCDQVTTADLQRGTSQTVTLYVGAKGGSSGSASATARLEGLNGNGTVVDSDEVLIAHSDAGTKKLEVTAPGGLSAFRLKGRTETTQPFVVFDDLSFNVPDPPQDTTPPDTTITEGPSGSVRGSRQSFSFSSTEAPASFRCSMDDAAFSPCGSGDGFSGLGVGEHTFRAAAVDAAGNVDPSPASRTFRVYATNQTQPDTVITKGPEGSVTGRDQLFEFEEQPEEDGVSFECAHDSSGFGPCPSPYRITGLAYGAHTFRVRLRDAGGVEDPTPATRAFTVTAAPPADGELTGPKKLSVGEPAVFTASFSGEVERYEWDLDDAGTYDRSTGSDPTYSRAFEPGPHVLRVRATGPGGQATASISIDVERPAVAGVEYEPAAPKVGQEVRMHVVDEREKGDKVLYYAWKVPTVKPKDRTLSFGRSGRGAGARSAGKRSSGTPVEIKLTSAQPTKAPRLTRKFTKPGTHRVQVGVVGDDGLETTVYTDIKVAPKNSRVVNKTIPKDKLDALEGVKDCNELTTLAGGICGSIAVDPKTPTVGWTTTLIDASPGWRACTNLPSNFRIQEKNLNPAQAKLNLGYPPDSQFVDETAAVSGGLETKESCVVIPTDAVHWDLGDGTQVPEEFNQLGTTDKIVPNVYTEQKKYTVELVTRHYIPVEGAHSKELFPKKLGQETAVDPALKAKLVKEGVLASYLVRTSLTLDVKKPYCGLLELNNITVRAFTGDSAFDDPFTSEDDCFLVEQTPTGSAADADDGKAPLYSLMAGATASLNGISVTPLEGAKGYVLVDQEHDNIRSSVPEEELQLTFFEPRANGPSFRADLGRTKLVDVPKQTHDPELNASVSPLPDYEGGLSKGTFNGFPATGARVFLSPNRTAYAKVSVNPPSNSPLGGNTPSVVLGGMCADGSAPNAGPCPVEAGVAFSHLPDGADFVMDLGGTNIGPFETEGFHIAHYPDGTWRGGGRYVFDLGEKYTLQANYADESGGQPTQCSDLGSGGDDIKGPSGLEFNDNTGFTHAGGSVIPDEPIVVGPVGITCFGASLKRNEKLETWKLVGLVSGDVPAATSLLTIDACVMVSILKKGQTDLSCDDQTFCGEDITCIVNRFYTAKQNEVWVAGRGTVSLLDTFRLGKAGFDIHAGADLLNISAFGRLGPYEFGPFGVSGGVTGLILILPKPGFMFTGDVTLSAGPVDVGVKAVVSSKGIGACADLLILSGGFVYRWGGDLDLFGGCNWEKFDAITVTAGSLPTASDWLAGPSGGRALGGFAKKTVSVSRRESQVAFDVTGAEQKAPLLKVTDPDGETFVGPAAPGYSRLGGRRGVGFLVTEPKPAQDFSRLQPNPSPVARKMVVPAQPGRTVVTLLNAKPGKYTLEIQDGSGAMTSVSKSVKLPPRRILADIKGSGRDRRLSYFVSPVPGQTVEFVEEGVPARTRRQAPSHGSPVGRVITTVGEPRENRSGPGLRPLVKTVDLPDGYGIAGPRKVYAVISQDGVPIKKQLVPTAGYTAPPPPAVRKPDALRVERTKADKLRVCWKPVPRAREYEVTVKASDGRLLLERAKARQGRPCLELRGFDESVSAEVDVRTVAPWGESEKRAGGELRRKQPSKVLFEF